MIDKRLTIGRLSDLTGVPKRTIRYYEDVGILPKPSRNEAKYRIYEATDLRRLELVRRARMLALPLAEVRQLVRLAENSNCDDFQGHFLKLVSSKRGEVDRRIADLENLKQDLQRLEAHFMNSANEAEPDHVFLECSPETCTCLGAPRIIEITHRR